MKISYIPAALPTTGSFTQTMAENALRNVIVIPFKNACLKGWIIFIEVGGIVTLFVAMAGLIAYIGGVKKGKNIAITCGTIHLILQLLNYFIMG